MSTKPSFGIIFSRKVLGFYYDIRVVASLGDGQAVDIYSAAVGFGILYCKLYRAGAYHVLLDVERERRIGYDIEV